jgi:uncharacterized iron-regulated membrane protein
MKRLLFQVHRWLGVVLALFMLLWFFSGLVIVYAPPTVQSKAQQLAHAELLLPQAGWLSVGEAWQRSAGQRQALIAKPAAESAGQGAAPNGKAAARNAAAGNSIADARLLREDGEPLWLVENGRGQRFALSAVDGTLRTTSPEQAVRIAAHWLGQPAAALQHVETFERDSTVRNLDDWRPFHRIAADDGRELLVSARTGEVLRVADRLDRALFWAGNWLHLFRPLESLGWGESRRDVLTWVSGITIIATLTGLIVGWLRWRPGFGGRRTYAEGRVHPYRAFWFRWHFWSGLLGGIVALLWIASGFLVNNPWQVFSAAAANREELARYQGASLPPAMRDWQPATLGATVPEEVVELGWRRLGEQALLLASTRSGERQAVADSGAPQRFDDAELFAAALRLSNNTPLAGHTLQSDYDSYYYPRHHQTALDKPLPVLRVDLADPVSTRLYLDPQDGRLLLKQDNSRRAYRWLFSAIHHWDFGWLYARPLWDGWMLLWIGFGLVLSASSLVIGWKRLQRTFPVKRRSEVADEAQAGGKLATENQAG